MSSYVKSTLMEGEKVICKAHYHWFWWAKRIILYLLVAGAGFGVDAWTETGWAGPSMFAIVLCCFGYDLLRYTHDEMVITNRRVVLKTRILARDVFEMQIGKVETVGVDQSVLGRIFNFGRISCCGTGGTTSKPIEIADPLAFRAAFQNAIGETLDAKAAPQPVAIAELSPALNADKLDEVIALLKEINSKLDKQQTGA